MHTQNSQLESKIHAYREKVANLMDDNLSMSNSLLVSKRGKSKSVTMTKAGRPGRVKKSKTDNLDSSIVNL